MNLEKAIAFDCIRVFCPRPACHADKGDPCVDYTGKFRKPHVQREAKWVAYINTPMYDTKKFD